MKRGKASRLLHFALAALLSAGVSQSAWSFTPAQKPLTLSGQVEPNILFILDDSGSMRWGFMPDELRPDYLAPSENWYELRECQGRGSYAGVDTHFCSKDGRRYLTSNHLNKVYFDPDTTYSPPIKSDGSRFANATFTAAWIDGYAGGSTVNLSNAFMAIMDDYYTPQSYECLNRRCTQVRYYKGFAVGASTGGVAAFYHEFSGGGSCASNPRQDSCYTERTVSASQQQNFANWFSYYRNRLMAAKAGVSQAFYEQSGDIRVGYGAINLTGNSVDGANTDTLVRGVRRFEDSGRSDFYSWLFASQASGGTPLRRALGDAGAYYSRTDSTGPWSSTPGTSGGDNYACRQSYTILTTDGYWNGAEASESGARNNVDNSNGQTIEGPDGESFRYVPAAPFNDSQSGTLADVAMHYWNRDLHSSLANRVPTAPDNPAFWQHMVTFGVGLGVNGSVDPATAFASVGSGDQIAWPAVTGSDEAKIDDLLHASVNSRGGFFNAQDPQVFASALSDTLQAIGSRVGSNTSATANSRTLDSGTRVYDAYYSSSDWSGRLIAKQPIETSAGIRFTELWDAGERLSASGRRLFSHQGGAGNEQGVALAWSGLSTAMRGYFDNTQALFNYLMGDSSNEAPAGNRYRQRSTLLGDIVNSSLVLSKTQDWGFDSRVPTPSGGVEYSDFVEDKSSRTPTLFVGANDGFLHAFDADDGDELFAYMPNGVLPHVAQLADQNYAHRYFVDGALHVRDAVLGSGWRTVLLGTLGSGGKSVFALDVTDTSASGFGAEDVLWEIQDADDLGYVYGEPLIGRLKDGSWAAIFGNGHGSANDDSVLFIVDLASGAVNKVRAGEDTGGLSAPSFVYATDSSGHIYVEEIYAGDLSGNLWKFNLANNGTGADDFEVSLRSGGQPQPLYVATDAAGNRQPITVKPEIAAHPQAGNEGNMIYFGTGRLYSVADLGDNATQTLYGIWDKPRSNGASTAFSGRSVLDQRTILFEGEAFDKEVRALDAPTEGIDWSTQRGWYLDLVSPVAGAEGERLVASPRILLNRLVVQTTIPSSDVCAGGGSSWTMVLDLATGGRLNYVLFDMNGDGNFDSNDMVSVDGQPLPVSGIGSSSPSNDSFDLLGQSRYWLCRGTGEDDCIAAANTLNVIEGRQSWMQLK